MYKSSFISFFNILFSICSDYGPSYIFHSCLSLFNSQNCYLSLFLSLLFLIFQFFKSYLCCVNFCVCDVTHVFRYFFISELMVFIKFDGGIELLEMFIWPIPISQLSSIFSKPARTWWSITILLRECCS